MDENKTISPFAKAVVGIPMEKNDADKLLMENIQLKQANSIALEALEKYSNEIYVSQTPWETAKEALEKIRKLGEK